jgi:hypothetical protein
MDQVVAQSLKTYSKMDSARWSEPSTVAARPHLIEALAYKSDISVSAS